jgi:hypothetical protein
MGALARLSDAADTQAKAFQHQLDLLKHLVGKRRVPMNRLMFLMQHPIYGWSVFLRALYLLGHATVPEGPDACAVRNKYAKQWLKTTASVAIQHELEQDYKNYCVRIVYVHIEYSTDSRYRRTSTASTTPSWARGMLSKMRTPALLFLSTTATCKYTSVFVDSARVLTCSYSVMQAVGPLLENLATGLRRTTGLVLYTLIAGHVRAGDGETIRVTG